MSHSQGYILLPGLRAYDEMLVMQRRINEARRQGAIPDTVIFLEHYPCLTIGAKGGRDSIMVSSELLNKQGIQVYETDRGGDVTYHGPGQIVCYPIIDLHRYACDVTTYARNLEEMLIRTLDSFGISAHRKEGFPGVWVDEKRKIAAQGISVERWVTMHGVALNVCPDMVHFGLIIPCGLKGCGAVSMADYLGHAVDTSAVLAEMIHQFSTLFEIELEEIGEDKIKELLDHAHDQTS
ncbi:MAG TPA: lipoyl(octanoyl) transferase LipB [Syntrophorhabdaceae bacterium]|nr:lipoyl(octanoyl) transferase LipB [Syntrophorhabdaceae bacterium]HPA07212.1 lipoyl(octanoyl) transferase LipB [Methanoregulaceae archaeon]